MCLGDLVRRVQEAAGSCLGSIKRPDSSPPCDGALYPLGLLIGAMTVQARGSADCRPRLWQTHIEAGNPRRDAAEANGGVIPVAPPAPKALHSCRANERARLRTECMACDATSAAANPWRRAPLADG